MAGERWLFTRSQLVNTPSRKCGIDSDKELNYRQQAANFIQDMGQRLQVTQLCINTAIVYLHRFYMFHSLTKFHRNSIASACLFLAAKVEEQPRKLEHVIKVAHMCLHREAGPLDTKSEQYLEQAQELVVNENILLQSLGFEITVDHPNSHVVKTCTLVRASKDLAQTSYFLATNSLHLTTFCIQYPPTVVACVCIHLACKWSKWELPQSREGKDWWWYTDRSVTLELLEGLTQEFLSILEKCPSKLKRKINAFKHGGDRKDLDMPNYKEPAPLSTPSPWKSREPSATITSATSGETAPQQMTTPSSIQHPTATNHDRQAAGVASQHPVPREPPSFQPPDVAPKPKLGASVGPPEGLRRVRTEPALTAREYLERKERERQAAAAAQAAAHNSQADHKGEPHHMDNIFNLMKEKPPAEPNNTQVSKEQSQMQDRHARERLNPVQSRDKLSELPQGRHSRPEHGHDKHTVDLHGVKDKMPDQSQSKDRSRSDRGRPHGPRDKHRGEHSRERHHAEQSEHAQRAGSAQKTMPAVSEASTRSPLKLSISLNRDRDKHLSVRESASSKLVELNADGGVRQNTHMSSASQDASAAHISPSKHGRAGPGLGAGPTKSGALGEEGAGEYVSTPPASGGSLKLRISKDMLSSSGHKEKHRHSGSRHSSSKSHSGSRADKDKSSRKRPRSPIEKIKLNLSAIQGQHTPNKLQRTADGPAFSSGPPRDPYALEQDILSPSQAANGSRTNSPQGQTPGPNMTDVQRTLQKLIDIQKANLALKTCQTAGSIGTPMSMPMGGTMERGIGQYAYHSMYADPNLALGMVMPGSAPPPPPPPPPSEPPPVPPPPPPE